MVVPDQLAGMLDRGPSVLSKEADSGNDAMAQTDSERQDASAASRLPGIVLMASILLTAAVISAITAMGVAIRGREVAVPDLIGKTRDEAESVLVRSGLALRVASRRFSNRVTEGHVLDQIPPGGSDIKANRTVKVLISLGERRFRVPDLLGTSLRATELVLAERGLSLGNTLYAHTPDGQPSTIVYQSPKPGSAGGSDPSVNVLVSLGPLDQYYIMPDLIDQPASVVGERVRLEGFRLGRIQFREYPGLGRGIVIHQEPRAGYRISKSEPILLEVSQ